MSSAARKLYDSPVYSQERTVSKPLVKKNVKHKAKAKERLPTLPRYINIIISILDTVFKSLVIPAVIPTVPLAENASNTTSCMANGCIPITIKMVIMVIPIFKVAIILAVAKASSSKRFPNA